jgi:hypothetical protein
MTRALLTSVLLFAAGCSGTSPVSPDGGNDGGNGTQDGGNDGGGDGGGVPSDDQCGPTAGGCDAGSSCLRMQLEDGGRARRCLPGACDLVAQDCGATLKCEYRDGGRSCVPDGTLAEGAPCANMGFNCIKGTVCSNVPAGDGGQESRCTKFCSENANCTPPQQCLLTLVLPDSNERPQICADPPPTCDLLTQSCPAVADGCYPNGATGACFGAGVIQPGQGCVFSNDCVRGSTCVNTTGGASCRQLCAFPSGAPSCDAGTCTRLTGTTGVGVCVN